MFRFALIIANVFFVATLQANAAGTMCVNLFQDPTGRPHESSLSQSGHDSYFLTSKKIPISDAEKILAGDLKFIEKYEITEAEANEIKILLLTVGGKMVSRLAEVAEFLRPDIGLPEKIEVHLSLVEERPAAHLVDDIMRIGYQYRVKSHSSGQTELKTPKQTLTINIHEYAHLVLATQLKKLPFFDKMIKRSVEVREKRFFEITDFISSDLNTLEELDSNIASLENFAKRSNEFTEKYIAELAEAKRQRIALLNKIRPQLEEVSFLRENPFQASNFFAHYHELFADLVPVVYLDNPNAIFDVLKTSENEASSSNIARSFRIDASTKLDDFKTGFVHDAMGATRRHIGEKILPMARTIEDRQRLVKCVLQAIIEEAASVYETESYLLPVTEANRRIIERIDMLWGKKPRTP